MKKIKSQGFIALEMVLAIGWLGTMIFSLLQTQIMLNGWALRTDQLYQAQWKIDSIAELDKIIDVQSILLNKDENHHFSLLKYKELKLITWHKEDSSCLNISKDIDRSALLPNCLFFYF